MTIFEYRFFNPQYTTGPAPCWVDITTRNNAAKSEAVVAGSIEESLLVFKRNRPGANIVSITDQGPALT